MNHTEEEKVVEEPAPGEKKEYTVKAAETVEPGGPGEGRPTPPPEPPKEDKK